MYTICKERNAEAMVYYYKVWTTGCAFIGVSEGLKRYEKENIYR